VVVACTNIQRVASGEEEGEEGGGGEEEEEEGTQHADTWRNVRVWVDFLLGLH
jgi:hypothetical protein